MTKSTELIPFNITFLPDNIGKMVVLAYSKEEAEKIAMCSLNQLKIKS